MSSVFDIDTHFPILVPLFLSFINILLVNLSGFLNVLLMPFVIAFGGLTYDNYAITTLLIREEALTPLAKNVPEFKKKESRYSIIIALFHGMLILGFLSLPSILISFPITYIISITLISMILTYFPPILLLNSYLLRW